MKKIIYLLAFVAIAFASCDPLSKTYKDLDAQPQTVNVSLSNTFKSTADAKTAIPAILAANTTYNAYPEGSVLNVSFALPASQPIVPDSTYSHVAYTLVPSDYAYAGNTTLTNLSATQVLAFLAYKYPTPANNQLAVLTYNYFESGYTTGSITTDSFLFLNGSWTKIYTVSPGQYASVGRGLTNTFNTADLKQIPTWLSSFLANDLTVSTAVNNVGDYKYISYRYATTYQKVLALMWNGASWVDRDQVSFIKQNGVWIPIITVIFGKADYAVLANATMGTAAARANVVSFGDFNIQSPTSTTYWTDADLKAAIIFMLKAKVPSPVVNNPYRVTYAVYTGTVSNVTGTYVYDGTNWILK
ncbi:hypothetical protein BEL04_09690 [Mucilaginibacter sp. PPCGB 2223]|uniref:hypothetical protein n=1 Tax=Mucilaginibacter sp. PPCGB 2223 TaxID=1886027 RepID=UPI0008271546|nr:hypothetical protein [Mucilaginibacter sp. PPCGB 2223]OCX54500.1 hypothetical protein BEL04_09690 [Mucilaginibacter sp. PPCGB 2223]